MSYRPPFFSSVVPWNHLILGCGLASKLQVITKAAFSCLITGLAKNCGALPSGLKITGDIQSNSPLRASVYYISLSKKVIFIYSVK